MSYDHIAAGLQCPVCQAVTTDEWPLFQVRWTLGGESATYRPGDRVPTASPHHRGYLAAGGGDPSGRLRVLDVWQCPTCRHPWNLAVTTLEDDAELIASVEAVPLAPAAFRSVEYVTDQIRYVYRDLTGERMLDDEGEWVPDWLERLIAALDVGDGSSA